MYLSNKAKAFGLLRRAMFKADRKKGLKSVGQMWDTLQLLFSIFGDYIRGNYREIPKRSITMIIVAILYFTLPADAIFDYIPFGGYIDDAAVIGFVLSQINKDLERYRLWRGKKN